MVQADPRWGTATLIGALETCYGVGQLIGSSFMGRVSDTLGRRAVLLLSFTGSAVGYGLTARRGGHLLCRFSAPRFAHSARPGCGRRGASAPLPNPSPSHRDADN